MDDINITIALEGLTNLYKNIQMPLNIKLDQVIDYK